MHFTKKIDRARQWAGEKMGSEARTNHTEEFKDLESEMNLRHQGMERLQKATHSYVRWASRRCDALEDKERASPMGMFGRIMAAHGEEYEPDSQLGNSLVAVGQANERMAALQEVYVEQTNESWASNIERSLTMMKEYQASRKKLENRRLAYDASTAKLSKARRDDFRIEEEVRSNKVKFEESSEDVLRRMQDIKEAEVDTVAAIQEFLDFELDYHERCVEELRRAREIAASGAPTPQHQQYGTYSPPRPSSTKPQTRSRSNTARSLGESRSRQASVYEEAELEPVPVRRPIISTSLRGSPQVAPLQPPRPPMPRSWTAEASRPGKSAPPPLPLTRVRTDVGHFNPRGADDVFADDASTASGSASTDYGDRSLSPATSYGSLGHAAAAVGARKAPPPPPVNRAKKPAPPVPARKENLGY